MHQRLRDEHGLAVSVSSFRRYVWREFPEEQPAQHRHPAAPRGRRRARRLRSTTATSGTWLDPLTERMRRVWAFVMVLACSRHMFVRPVFTMDQRAWTACHVEAFEFFGGVPRRLVSDNLKTGVIKPDIYDPLLNRSYAELGRPLRLPHRPGTGLKPKDKPRVERQMPYVRDSMWRGRDWLDLADMQPAALRLVHRGGRACARTARSTERRPLSVFSAVEAPALLTPLPRVCLRAGDLEPTRRSGPTATPRSGKAIYTVPWRFIGQPPRRPARGPHRRVLRDGKVIKTWARIEQGQARPTGPTSRPRRWPSSCAPRSGASSGPASSAST